MIDDSTYPLGVERRRLGPWRVSAIGIGCMPMSFPGMVDERERALHAIHAALDAGFTLLDTADIYAPSWDTMGHNETLVAEAVRTYSGDVADVVLATKGGITRQDGEGWGRDSSPDGLRRAAEASLARLGRIDLYQHHRHDPSLSYAVQMITLGSIRDAGIAATIGLSNATRAEVDLAVEILGGPDDGGIVSVQNEWSPRFREDADVIDRCAELGIAFLPWSPLGGSDQAHDLGSLRQHFAAVADRIGASPQETALAWLLARSPVVIPIPGITRAATVASLVRAEALALTEADVAYLDASPSDDLSMYPEAEPRSRLR